MFYAKPSASQSFLYKLVRTFENCQKIILKFLRIVSASSCENWRCLKTTVHIRLIGDLLVLFSFLIISYQTTKFLTIGDQYNQDKIVSCDKQKGAAIRSWNKIRSAVRTFRFIEFWPPLLRQKTKLVLNAILHFCPQLFKYFSYFVSKYIVMYKRTRQILSEQKQCWTLHCLRFPRESKNAPFIAFKVLILIRNDSLTSDESKVNIIYM